ncbi:sulfatase [Siansivirga zeaxanthinifaciens]|uniref:Sulfatase n=1 Tax=Siansivirga zeaxanthinifaciens CC-SAMT-1 TaxID=1454006 RepID=A0A0C5WBL4_9FLAO|nr:sulfatase [Siansivirga zeaxanthinifaciens]AJR04503.1 sulfatase [Siansivirga zeaxanthinifaciens CC-SAMT-1]
MSPFFKLKIPLIIILISSGCFCSNGPKPKPNIIFILADDFGYMDTQAYAAHTLGVSKNLMYYETPNIDRLVSEGVAFDQAYANQLCSPTRSSLLTGKYAARLGFTTATPERATYYNQNLPVPEGSYAHDVINHSDNIKIEMAWLNGSSNTALPSGAAPDNGWDETTIPEALTDYNSCFIGKWHLGGHGAKGYTPLDQGFDEAPAWFDAGASKYINWRSIWNNRSKSRFPNAPQDYNYVGNGGEETGKNYLTDDLTQHAIRYIEKQSKSTEQPFFLYLSHFAVHGPYEAKKEDVDYFKNKKTSGWNNHKDEYYAGMIKALDNSVGRILDKLQELGLDDNTLVVFMSDNGGIDYRVTPNGKITSNYPLTGGKACLTEGGIRVPLVFRWKGTIAKGKWSHQVVDCSDIFPTLIEAAGYNPGFDYQKENSIDGRSLFGLLNDVDNKKNSYKRNTHYWYYPFNVIYNNPYDGLSLTPHSAIREGDYKLIFDWHGRLKLFNIGKDISETNNLAKQMPELTNRLFDKLMAWTKENVKSTYWPKLNLNYNLEKDVHDVPFVDLLKIYNEGGNVAASAN